MNTESMAGTEASEGLRERGKRQRTERILDAALAVLREAPDENLTIERVAARAEVSAMTVFNLVGSREQLWSAMADRALADLDIAAIDTEDPLQRALDIVDAVVRVLRSDAALFRVLLAGWSTGGRLLLHDPTPQLIACLRADPLVSEGVDVRTHGEVIAAGLIGVIHQWTAGLIGDRTLASRTRSLVRIAFAAARSGV